MSLSKEQPPDGDATRDLLARARGGDREAIDLLLRRVDPVLTRAVGGLRSMQKEEARQEAMLTIQAKVPQYQSRGIPFRRWVAAIASRCAMALRRRRGRAVPESELGGSVLAEVSASLLHSPSAGLRTQELERAFLQELDALPKALFEAVRLCRIEGLSNEDAGAVLGRPKEYVATSLSLGLSRVRAALRKRGWEIPERA